MALRTMSPGDMTPSDVRQMAASVRSITPIRTALKRARYPRDYQHLVLAARTASGTRAALLTPDGVIWLKRIGRGTFSTAYRDERDENRVFVFEAAGTHDKQIALEARAELPHNPHLPDVEFVGETRRGPGVNAPVRERVYTMPFYRMPLKKTDSARGWRDYWKLFRCQDEAWADMGVDMNPAMVECAKEARVSPAVVEALDALVTAAARYGDDYRLDIWRRNFATDSRRRLVLLDVLMDWDHVQKRWRQQDATDRRAAGKRAKTRKG